MTDRLQQVLDLHSELLARGISIVADEPLLPEGLQSRMRQISIRMSDANRRLDEGRQRLARGADIRSRYDSGARELLEWTGESREALAKPVQCADLEDTHEQIQQVVARMDRHAEMMNKFDIVSRTAELLADPAVPSSAADIPVDMDVPVCETFRGVGAVYTCSELSLARIACPAHDVCGV